MVVSHSLGLIFVSNPKAASRSIEAALARYNEEPHLNEISREGFYTRRHMPAAVLRERLGPTVWNGYFKFGVVRNPWDWFVSQHFYNLRKSGIQVDQARSLSINDILSTYELLKQWRGVDWSGSGFQYSFLCDSEGMVLPDFLGRFERLREDFGMVQDRIGVRLDLPHLNRTEHGYYKSYYSPETRALVARLYETDVNIFGYSF